MLSFTNWSISLKSSEDSAPLSSDVPDASSPLLSSSSSSSSSSTFSGFFAITILYPAPNLFFKKSDVPQHYTTPSARMQTWSPSISASSIWWVVRMIILSRLYVFSISQKRRRVVVSIPDVGSSSKTSLESPIRAIPAESLRLWPPERVDAS